MKIAISKASGSASYERYGKWLSAANPNVEIVDMIGLQPKEAAGRLSLCDGLILSGGADVAPERYNEPEKRALCTAIDEQRDALEFALANRAYELSLPVLGICRGMQLLNVVYGGTLVADISTQLPDAIEHKQIDGVDSMHGLSVEPGSIIRRICGALDGEINSSHHQCVERLASLFTPSAISPDGVVEAFEWGDASMGGKPFLLAVQWHPERMDYESPFSLPIAKHFLSEAEAYSLLLRS